MRRTARRFPITMIANNTAIYKEKLGHFLAGKQNIATIFLAEIFQSAFAFSRALSAPLVYKISISSEILFLS